MAYPVKYSAADVQKAIRTTTCELQKQQVLHADVMYVVMLNGGIWFASHVFDCLGAIDNEVCYVKCHSYQGRERHELVWDYLPELQVQGREVVVLDDICDSGQTATALVRYLREHGAKSVAVFTLLRRTTTKIEENAPLYSCIIDPSADFFVGCGLDNNGRSRLLPYIGVIE